MNRTRWPPFIHLIVTFAKTQFTVYTHYTLLYEDGPPWYAVFREGAGGLDDTPYYNKVHFLSRYTPNVTYTQGEGLVTLTYGVMVLLSMDIDEI